MITKRKVRKLTVGRKIRKKRVGALRSPRSPRSGRKLGLKKRIIVRKRGRAIRRLKPIVRRKGKRGMARRLIRFPRRRGSRIIARRRKVHRRIVPSRKATRAQRAYDQAFNEAYNAGYGVGFTQGYTWELANPTIA